MKKLLFLMMFSLPVMGLKASEVPQTPDSLLIGNTESDLTLSMSLEPAYLKDVCEGGDWKSNWFVEAKGGTSFYLGSPIGKGNVFDHAMPVLQVGVGKWLTPDAGVRLAFQGFQFKNANLETMHYQSVHADFLWNVTGSMSNVRLDVIPYAGVGLIRNSDWERHCTCKGSVRSSHPFAFSYGVQMRYPVGKRLHLVAEVSGLSTLKNFDCVSTSEDFGDHMLNISAGLSLTLGRSGWKKVLDARPYIRQNAILTEELATLRTKIAEEAKEMQQSPEAIHCQTDKHVTDTICIDVPVYFYFNRNTADLVNSTQLSNLEEIARLVKDTNFCLCITGAADSTTGTSETNQALSEARARYIADKFILFGIPEERIITQPLGGIYKFQPMEANRNTCVTVIKQ